LTIGRATTITDGHTTRVYYTNERTTTSIARHAATIIDECASTIIDERTITVTIERDMVLENQSVI
jgi:hypothetical protein